MKSTVDVLLKQKVFCSIGRIICALNALKIMTQTIVVGGGEIKIQWIIDLEIIKKLWNK